MGKLLVSVFNGRLFSSGILSIRKVSFHFPDWKCSGLIFLPVGVWRG